MKISALVAKLEDFKSKNGDIDLRVIARVGKNVDLISFNPDIKYTQIHPMKKAGWIVNL